MLKTSNIMKLFIFFLLLPALLSGCAGKKSVMEAEEVETATRTRIERAADTIHNDLTRLAELLSGKSAPVPAPRAQGELARPVTLKWAGPALPAVESVAKLVGFMVEVKGHTANQPVVYVNAVNTPALAVLEDIGWQAGSSFGLVVKEDRRTVYVFLGEQQ